LDGKWLAVGEAASAVAVETDALAVELRRGFLHPHIKACPEKHDAGLEKKEQHAGYITSA
jgi:hypothetical protein